MLGLVKEISGQKTIVPLTTDTGTGAPVGSFIYMYKKSSPSGYLYCDGSTFDETVYPALYLYLGSNVLPDYRECVMVGAEQNTTDTIATHDVYTQGEFKDDQLQDHTHSAATLLANGSGTLKYGSGGNSIDWITGIQGISSGRKGTVTRGKRKAVYVYIKATSGLAENQQENVLNATKDYVDNSNSYSTSETLTGGKWIDGKPIYRKVYYRSETTPFQYDSITLESGFTNTKNLIKAEGTVKLNNDNVVTLPYIDASDTMEIFIDQYGNLNTFTINNAYNVYWYSIIVEYTKTTD